MKRRSHKKGAGARVYVSWSDEERRLLRENYPLTGSLGCMSVLPGRSREEIRAMASYIGASTGKRYASVKERFEASFRVTPGCWPWHGFTRKGYGIFSFNGRPVLAHRHSYTIYVGDIPGGLCVCHRCDSPRCVNPDHFWLGTNAENTADKVAKGRTARQPGEINGMSKLTDAIVIAIRADIRKQKDIASTYGVDQSLISLVKSRKIWSHVKDSA